MKKIATELWKYSYYSDQTFTNESVVRVVFRLSVGLLTVSLLEDSKQIF